MTTEATGEKYGKLGWDYFFGTNNVQVNKQRAKNCWELALKNGNQDYLFLFSRIIIYGAEGVQSHARYGIQLLQNSTNHSCLIELANAYLFGVEGIPRNEHKAKELYEKCLNFTDGQAECNLGYLLFHGSKTGGVDRNCEHAVQLFKKVESYSLLLAESFYFQGYVGHLLKTGQIYSESFKLSPDSLIGRAARLLFKYLSDSFRDVVSNYKTYISNQSVWTRDVFDKISDRQFVGYNFVCGICFENGLGQIPENMEIAILFYQKAVIKGHLDAIQRLYELDPSSSPTYSMNTAKKETQKQDAHLQTAYLLALSRPEALTEQLLLKYVRPQYVTSAEALFCGHNLILLSIRAGVLSTENFRDFGGSLWYFKENLYLPASKLVDENPHFLDSVFHHAEKVGIVKDAFVFKCLRELRLDVTQALQQVATVFGSLAKRLNGLESRVSSLEKHVSNMSDDIFMLVDGFQQLGENQVRIQEAVKELSFSLSNLKELLRKKERRSMYSGAAKCFLSLVPVIGQSLGEAFGLGAELVVGMSGSDLISSGKDIASKAISSFCDVDISNFRLVRMTFSGEGLSKLNPETKKIVLDSINRSGFGDLEQMQLLLKAQGEYDRKENMSAFLLDNGECPWKEPNEQVKSKVDQRVGSSTREDTDLEEVAKMHFNLICRKKGLKALPIDLAHEEVNKLQDEANLETLTMDEFLDILDGINDNELVNETTFVEIVEKVRDDQRLQQVLQDIESSSSMFFDKSVSGTTVPTRLCARIMVSFLKSIPEEESVKLLINTSSLKHQTRTETLKYLQATNEQEDDSIDKEKFVRCAMNIVKENLDQACSQM